MLGRKKLFSRYKIMFLMILVFVLSCKSEPKRPGEIIVSGDDIDVHWYGDTSLYNWIAVVSVTRGDSSVVVFKQFSNIGIADIIIENKTITIKSLPKQYNHYFKDEAFNYTIKLDTTITREYWRRKTIEWDKQR